MKTVAEVSKIVHTVLGKPLHENPDSVDVALDIIDNIADICAAGTREEAITMSVCFTAVMSLFADENGKVEFFDKNGEAIRFDFRSYSKDPEPDSSNAAMKQAIKRSLE